MSISGAIVEYNPFHYGHLYHLSQVKKISDYNIAIMSGHFLQRGEPALFNKWIRTRMALEAGVDIVLELPTIYSCQSAELFAFGAVNLLDQLNIVDYLIFGSETNNIDDLYNISKVLAFEPQTYKDILKIQLKEGHSFPKARSNALKHFFSRHDSASLASLHVLKNPNDILGIEYIKWLLRLKSPIQPITIQRIGSGYHSKNLSHGFASATAIRDKILHSSSFPDELKTYLPSSSSFIIRNSLKYFCPGQLEALSKSIFTLLLRMDRSDLKNYLDINEGLQDRFYRLIHTNSIEKYIASIKTKRYTYTRIQRILCHILLDLKKDELQNYNDNGGAQYIRILGFSKRGREILPLLKKRSNLPIITNLSKSYSDLDNMQRRAIDYDILATNIYHAHFAKTSSFKNNMDYLTPPIIL